jgi:hypothetical protein
MSYETLLQENLQKISDTFHESLPREHKEYLIRLKKSGFEPHVIYDIGACVLHWTRFAETLWPDAKYIVFDAFQPAEFLYKNEDSGYNHHLGVLSDEDYKQVKFYQNDFHLFQSSYFREVGCQCMEHYDMDDYIEQPSMTLDTIVERNDFPLPDFVKISVEGAERDIINGGKKTFTEAQYMIVDMYYDHSKLFAPTVHTTLPCITQLGWKCSAPLFTDTGTNGYFGFTRC